MRSSIYWFHTWSSTLTSMTFCTTYNMALGEKVVRDTAYAIPCWSSTLQGMWVQASKLFWYCWIFKGLWYSKTLQTPLEAPPVWNQRNALSWIRAFPWNRSQTVVLDERGIRIGPRNFWGTSGLSVSTDPVPCLHQWPAVWAVITSASLCRWHGRVPDSWRFKRWKSATNRPGQTIYVGEAVGHGVRWYGW